MLTGTCQLCTPTHSFPLPTSHKCPEQINQELMNRVNSNPLWWVLPKHITNYVHALWSKKAKGQPVTFTDIFRMLIGETLIPSVRIWCFEGVPLFLHSTYSEIHNAHLAIQRLHFSFCFLNRGWTPSWVSCRKRQMKLRLLYPCSPACM